jgi:hypothetical protein
MEAFQLLENSRTKTDTMSARGGGRWGGGDGRLSGEGREGGTPWVNIIYVCNGTICLWRCTPTALPELIDGLALLQIRVFRIFFSSVHLSHPLPPRLLTYSFPRSALRPDAPRLFLECVIVRRSAVLTRRLHCSFQSKHTHEFCKKKYLPPRVHGNA